MCIPCLKALCYIKFSVTVIATIMSTRVMMNMNESLDRLKGGGWGGRVFCVLSHTCNAMNEYVHDLQIKNNLPYHITKFIRLMNQTCMAEGG